MSSTSELPSSIAKIRDRMSKPEVEKSLKGFSKTMGFSLTDLKEDYLLTIEDGKLASLEKKISPDANITIMVSNSLMDDILEKKTNPITAFMSGKLKAKGSMDDLLRLQQLMS